MIHIPKESKLKKNYAKKKPGSSSAAHTKAAPAPRAEGL